MLFADLLQDSCDSEAALIADVAHHTPSLLYQGGINGR
ncbi:MAG: hypothetical protein QOG51_446, partial [Verrucomicrobiota bacterium]